MSYGAVKYVKNLKFDEKTEIIEAKECPVVDLERVCEETKYDGYYAVITSELNMSDTEVINTYRVCGKLRRLSGLLREYWKPGRYMCLFRIILMLTF